MFACELEQAAGLGEGGGEGFFDEDGDRTSQEGFGDAGMAVGGYGDGDGIDLIEDMVEIGISMASELGDEFFGFGQVGVNDGDEMDVFHAAVDAAMEGAHFPGANDSGFNFFHFFVTFHCW